ncbi:MAG: UvrB/UvrC motif-containing protein [Clostridia bacterium]|nr:UvrB/UvrC motif-containing protein [Clostridia bacterium]
MLCERCKKNNATFFYNETVNGKTTSLSLCHECAKELEAEGKLHSHGFDGAAHFGEIDDLFSGFFAPAKKAHTPANEKRCTLCASTFADIVKNGKVGCAECYRCFSDELSRTVRSIHGNVKHIPRATPEQKEKDERLTKIDALGAELSAAIAAEEFERAAQLRDEIKKLKEEL